MDMQVECSEFQLKGELYKCIMLSCMTQIFCPFWEVFAQAGFILGWLSQGPIVKDARKSVVLGERQKEKENSCLVCRAQAAPYALSSLLSENKCRPQLWFFSHFKHNNVFFYENGLVLPKDNFFLYSSDVKKNEFSVYFNVFMYFLHYLPCF